MRKRKKMGLLAIAAAVFAGAGTVAQAAIIDDFELVSQYVSIDRNSGTTDLPYSFQNVGNLFGTRELYVELGDNRNAISLDVSGSVASDTSNFDAAPELILNSIAHITWDGNSSANPMDVDYDVGPGFDFSASTAFEVDVLGILSNPTKISIEVWDILGHTGVQDLVIPTNNGAIVSLGFNTFNAFSIDWSRIGAIRMNFLTDDVVIDNFRTDGALAPNPVPVPAAAGLGFLGMGLIAAFRRKQGAKVA